MCRWMYDAIHIQVKVVNLQVTANTFFKLPIQNVGVLIRQPAEPIQCSHEPEDGPFSDRAHGLGALS